VSAVVRYGFERFERFPLNRIEAVTDPENDASRRVLLKVGFTFEGLLRQHRFEKGRFVDECCYSLLRRDFLDWPRGA
jgi:ribosomal-protein-alanine N-acetyltransferase